MSIAQTYYLAHTARAKLSREAAQPDHDLRLLVGHANLLDSLMLELADAEREQERRFNQSVRGVGKLAERRVQWADKVVAEQPEEEYDDSDSSDSDSDDDADFDDDVDGVEMTTAPAMTSAPRPVARQTLLAGEDDEEDMGDNLEEDYAQLELVRTHSHASPPPELVHHDDSESSDDEATPPSPADVSLEYDDKDARQQGEDAEAFEDGFYISRQTPAGLISAISVY
ncbi:uncharacterized protein UV8b_02819 [Ustilaginoidea virens]|uniref:Uncharacterized protein n=1 Tax=Ustilaginoidea virens TaxID=1159556 RepID=A0A063BRX2_USTVR|nr:uncharacterized protein UV8b_02819 [Ustilaginoidea virens]QUC18578.1 hypothetical protein UV8b_02819 [Ustilaginoidea virens]GAO18420.1 hypothetical protein UVI_02046880 [Ustilaginoidea virens]